MRLCDINRKVNARAKILFTINRASIAYIGLLDLVLAHWWQTSALDQAAWKTLARRQLKRKGIIP